MSATSFAVYDYIPKVFGEPRYVDEGVDLKAILLNAVEKCETSLSICEGEMKLLNDGDIFNAIKTRDEKQKIELTVVAGRYLVGDEEGEQ